MALYLKMAGPLQMQSHTDLGITSFLENLND